MILNDNLENSYITILRSIWMLVYDDYKLDCYLCMLLIGWCGWRLIVAFQQHHQEQQEQQQQFLENVVPCNILQQRHKAVLPRRNLKENTVQSIARRRRIDSATTTSTESSFSSGDSIDTTTTMESNDPVMLDANGDEHDDEHDDHRSNVSSNPFEHATEQERQRFFLGKSERQRHQAETNLQMHLAWAAHHYDIEQDLLCEQQFFSNNDFNDDDSRLTALQSTGDADWDDWNMAAAIAVEVAYRQAVATTTTTAKVNCAMTMKRLPRVARMDRMNNGKDVHDCDGHRIIKLTPGMMEESLATLKTYALAISIYIHRKLNRESPEQICLMIDARGGRGWRNLNGPQLIPFIQHMIALLLAQFPARLGRAIVYPVPGSFRWIWTLARQCLDSDTASRIVLLTGTATIASPPPVQEMAQYMDMQVVQLIENNRLASFVPVRSNDEDINLMETTASHANSATNAD